MMNSYGVLPLPFTDTKILLSLLTVALGLLILCQIISSRKKTSKNTVEYPPKVTVETIEWVKARSKQDHSPHQSLALTGNMTSPVYHLKRLLYDLLVANKIHHVYQGLKDKDSYIPTATHRGIDTSMKYPGMSIKSGFYSTYLKSRIDEVSLQQGESDSTDHDLFFDCIEELEQAFSPQRGYGCSDYNDFFFDCNEEVENIILSRNEHYSSSFFDWEVYRNFGLVFQSAF